MITFYTGDNIMEILLLGGYNHATSPLPVLVVDIYQEILVIG